MSRRIANRGLAALLRAENVEVADIACICGVTRVSLWHYLHGRLSPRLEEKLAAHFKLTVPRLRRKLGLHSPALSSVQSSHINNNNNGGRRHGRKTTEAHVC